MNILLAEDEPRVAAFVRKGLTEEGHFVDLAPDGPTALLLAQAGSHDVIILDVVLPGATGLEVTAILRGQGVKTPILMLTAQDARDDIVRGLDAGADDYLTKPFDFAELLARIRALGRRSQPTPAPQVQFGNLVVDRIRHEVRRGTDLVPLTPTEFRLLETLSRTPGQAVSRTELLELVWDMTFDPGTSMIDVHMTNLRRKLEEGGHPRVIVAVRGIGFRLEAPEQP